MGGPQGSPKGWGRALRALRRRKNMKQEDVAGRLQVSQSYVSRLENGVVIPSPEIVERLSQLLYNPAYRPVGEQLRAIVRHSPHAVALMALKGDVIEVIEGSERFRETCPLMQPGSAGAQITYSADGPFADLFERMVDAGSFEGEVACIEFAWRAKVEGAWRHFHSIQTPIYASDRWLIHSVTSPISEDAYNHFLRENGGPERLHPF